MDRVNRFQRVRELERITNEMAEKEERLWFFENQDEIDLEIEQNELNEQNEQTKEEKINDRNVDENYVPPEIIPRRNQ